jgi:hypothetical protein
MDVMHQAAALPSHIAAVVGDISKSVPPFTALIQRVQTDYGAFGLADPANFRLNAKASLARQLRMVEWYYNKGQYVHALSMAREWLPSLLCFHFELDPMDENHRKDMEALLQRGGRELDPATGTVRESPYRAGWKDLAGQKRLARLWNEPGNLANLRNDVLHSGFRKKPRSAEGIAQITGDVVRELREIAVEWGVL